MDLDEARRKVVRKMYEMRFNEKLSEEYSVEQMRGIEGSRIRKLYEVLAERAGIKWNGRWYDYTDWDLGDLQNKCLSSATSCLYGVTEAAVLVAGYSHAIGFIHTGKPRSFVYDIADLFKFETVVPIAFRVAAENPSNPERIARLTCRDVLRNKVAKKDNSIHRRGFICRRSSHS